MQKNLMYVLFIAATVLLSGCRRPKPFVKRVFAEERAEPTKKRIMTFTSGGGGGHLSAARAVRSILQPEYEVVDVHLLRDVLAPIDPIKQLTFEYSSAEDLYNYLIKNRYVWFTNTLCKYGKFSMPRQDRSIRKLLGDFIDLNKPDLMISVIPTVNSAIIAVAKERNIPLIIVPTDLDNTMFILGMDDPEVLAYENYRYILPFHDEFIEKSIAPARIPQDRLVYGGFPVRPDFSQKKDIKRIKREFDVPLNRPVVTVLMGAAGSSSTYHYVKHLAHSCHTMHIVVCLGRNESLAKKLKKFPLPQHISMTLVGFTDRMPDIMAMSDLLITKCGTVSILEAIHARVPMLLDCTSAAVAWEELNIDFVQTHGFGSAINDRKQLDQLLEDYLHNVAVYQQCKENLDRFEKPKFEVTLSNLVDSMLGNV